jgi:putative hydrolase of the HAD superfamily
MKSRGNQALVLDFGGVITRTLFETHPATEKALGLPAGTLTWRGPFDPASDPLWRSMQADEITERDYWLHRTGEVGALLGKNWNSMSDLLIAARGDAPAEVIRPEFLDALRVARQASVRLAILSNELDLFYGPEFRKRLEFIDYFDVIHDATYTKTLKPSPEAYRAVIGDLGLPAEACVFVDDQARNVSGAERIGMRTVHFDVLDPAESYRKALQLLGLAA